MQGSGLALWEVAEIADVYGGDETRTAEHLEWPVARVRAALNYADAFAEEIAAAREDNRAYDRETVNRLLPGATVFEAGG
jgi:hypothetical protein